MKAIIAIAVVAALALSACASQQEKSGSSGQTASSSTSNAMLTGKVKSALAADVGLGTVTSIDVDSDNGVVTLKGHVDSADKKAKAEEIAKKVDGVKSVKNQLRVEPAKEKTS
ncbi:MAG TPA: BON domain-containing protein [Burkholderiales bacterium]|nr:BON domain-containing protein [Burkholderiales bacterium]